MRRVVVLGRGGAGKSTFARRLGGITGLPVVELDQEFWQAGRHPLAPDEWTSAQARLSAAERWIMDAAIGGALPSCLRRRARCRRRSQRVTTSMGRELPAPTSGAGGATPASTSRDPSATTGGNNALTGTAG